MMLKSFKSYIRFSYWALTYRAWFHSFLIFSMYNLYFIINFMAILNGNKLNLKKIEFLHKIVRSPKANIQAYIMPHW